MITFTSRASLSTKFSWETLTLFINVEIWFWQVWDHARWIIRIESTSSASFFTKPHILPRRYYPLLALSPFRPSQAYVLPLPYKTIPPYPACIQSLTDTQAVTF